MGVLGGSGNEYGAHEDVVLETPENYERLRDSRDGGYLERPIHGDELPEVTVPAPVQDRDLTSTEFVGDRHVLLTFIFTRCEDVCRTLTANLVRVQATAAQEGFAEDIALLPTTFDPEYDTGDRLAEYSEQYGADLDAGNWFPLRPASNGRAEAVISDTFGEVFEREEGGGEDHDHEGEDESDHDHVNFAHQPGSYVLANAGGYVERGYPAGPPNAGLLLDHVETLVERW
jgi:protein SCO1/2